MERSYVVVENANLCLLRNMKLEYDNQKSYQNMGVGNVNKYLSNSDTYVI